MSLGFGTFVHVVRIQIANLPCIGFRFFEIKGTRNCISFEALSWGFIQTRFHVGCTVKSDKLFDIWVNYKCEKEGTKACKQGKKAYEQHIQKISSLKQGQKSEKGILKESFDMAAGETKTVQLRNGLSVSVLVDNEKYLALSFGEFWRDDVLVCPNYSEKCVNLNNKYKIREVLSSMAKIEECEQTMRIKR